MSEGKIVVCPRCGKKYKLKAGFDAASFSCKQCSATVRVKPKSSATPKSGRRRRGAHAPSAPAASGSARRGRRATGRSQAKPRTGRAAGATRPGRAGRRERAAAAPPEEGEERRGHYQKKESSATLLLAIVGVVVVAGLIAFVATRGSSKEQTAKNPPAGAADSPPADSSAAAADAGDQAGKTDPAGQKSDPTAEPAAGTSAQPDEKPDLPADSGTSAGTDGGGKQASSGPARKLGRKHGKKSHHKRRYDPPADLGHIEGTSPELRKKIDDLITTMMDYDAGRDSLDAKESLIAIGKPAYPRILGAMAKIRDTITDVDSGEERLIESSLRLADQTLREMDGWLTAKQVPPLRPGVKKDYIKYICYLHYKRWMQKLKELPEMPGPFDPSGSYEGEAETYRGK